MVSADRSSGFGRYAAIAIVITLSVLVLVRWSTRAPRIVGHGTPIRYDDFAFEVVRCESVSSAGRTWQAVTVRVHNDAKRISFRVKPYDLVIAGADGQRFRPSADGRRSLEQAGRTLGPIDPELAAGTTADVIVVYELPADLPRPMLSVVGGGWLGGFLEHLIFGPQAIELEVSIRDRSGHSSEPGSSPGA
jgi:hypothetical protein